MSEATTRRSAHEVMGVGSYIFLCNQFLQFLQAANFAGQLFQVNCSGKSIEKIFWSPSRSHNPVTRILAPGKIWEKGGLNSGGRHHAVFQHHDTLQQNVASGRGRFAPYGSVCTFPLPCSFHGSHQCSIPVIHALNRVSFLSMICFNSQSSVLSSSLQFSIRSDNSRNLNSCIFRISVHRLFMLMRLSSNGIFICTSRFF